MKIVRVEKLIDAGGFSASPEWRLVEKEMLGAIRSVQWPPGSGKFTLYPERGKERGKGNGVKPIKQECMLQLERLGWELEARLDIATLKEPGRIDAVRDVRGGHFAIEWETGNISSSHRALNKMALGMLKGSLIGGALVVPTRDMYQYLTDRVGNLQELEPYFAFWKALDIEAGLLEVIAIEHDGLSLDVPKIRKGTEGRALQ
jgi:hypothetical protein